MPASAPSNTMVSCGSHSTQAPSPTSIVRLWLAQGPAVRYHLAAPGVVRSACAWSAARTAISSSSPPAMPPDSVADAVAFRVERLLHGEGSVLAARSEHGARPAALEAELELRAPCAQVDRFGGVHGSIIPPATRARLPCPCPLRVRAR